MIKPFRPDILPLDSVDWEEFLPNILRANSALATFEEFLENVQNPFLFLSPLMTKEAMLSLKIEVTQASLNDILEYKASPKRKVHNCSEIEEVINYREALLYAMEELNKRPNL